VFDPLLKLGAALLNCLAAGIEYEGLGSPCENSAPIFSWPSEFGTTAELLTPADGTAGAGGPYTGDGTRNVEEPSLPDEIGSG
jgi:hypothetical protein